MASYRLDVEPWIPCIMADGTTALLSLMDVLRQSTKISRIGGTPLEAAVIYRLLLAIAHTVRTPADEFEWLEIWNDREEQIAGMLNYVEGNVRAFDLYDQERPFGQTPMLEPGTATVAGLVYDRARGNNPVLLDHSRSGDPKPLSSAQAARALLVTHAYDGSGTGANNPLNSGKKDQMLAGPLCGRLIALVEGENLLNTLILNLASNVQVGQPSWERPPINQPGRVAVTGVADLYTRNTRAIRLKPSADGKHCVGLAIYQGEAVPDAEDSFVDPMIPRYLANDKRFRDLSPDPARAVWRVAHVLLAATETQQARPIRALEQLRPLAGAGSFPADEPVSLRILSIVAKRQGRVTTLWRDERLPFAVSVIADDARYAEMQRAVRDSVSAERSLERRLLRFARAYLRVDLSLQKSGDSKQTRDQLRSFVAELVDFRRVKKGTKTVPMPLYTSFWASLAPTGERIACNEFSESAWGVLLKNTSATAFQQAIGRLPPDARRLRAQYARLTTNQSMKGATA